MADLSVVAVITAKTGSEDVVRAALTDLVAPTRAEEGCRSYDLYESASVESTFVTIESWREQADLDAHMQTAHIAKTFEVAGEHLATAPAIHALRPIVVG